VLGRALSVSMRMPEIAGETTASCTSEQERPTP
jgi:hypothetical protein